MTTIRQQLLIGLTVVGLGIGAATAHDGRSGSGHRMGKAGFSEMKTERMEKRAAELQAKLNLNAEQQSAWNNFAAKMKPADRPARPSRTEMAKLPAPERMEKMHEMMKLREQQMANRVAATKEFYAVLTPEQRQTFDAHFSKGRPHHGRGRAAS